MNIYDETSGLKPASENTIFSGTVIEFLKQINNRSIRLSEMPSVDEALWNSKDDSSLMYSILRGSVVGDSVVAERNDSGGHDLLDGSRRVKAVVEYIGGAYKLGKINTVTDDSGEQVNFSGFYYNQLPAFAQKKICGYTIQVTCLPEMDPEDIVNLFLRIQALDNLNKKQ